MKLSRRAFLTGSAAVVAVAALPMPTAAQAPTYRMVGKRLIVTCYGAGGGGGGGGGDTLMFLYPSQWKRFKAAGVDMRSCRLVEMMGDQVSCQTTTSVPTSRVPRLSAVEVRATLARLRTPLKQNLRRACRPPLVPDMPATRITSRPSDATWARR